jgi:enoyl-CoA hydratase/carnithine racemase
VTDQVLIAKAEGVLTITLNRPDKKNALTTEIYQQVGGAIDAANDDPQTRVVLFEANGDMFTAGHDISEFAQINAGQLPDRPSGEPLLLALANAKKPLVAAVQGRAVGIGLTMLLHCDLVYVAEDALLSCPFVSLALVPEAASSLLLPVRIGHVRAFELFALGRTIDGRTAEAWGIANAAVPVDQVQGRAREAARLLAQQPAAAVAQTKALMREPALLTERIGEEFAHFYAQLQSPEAREAFSAFLEKRRPDFSKF